MRLESCKSNLNNSLSQPKIKNKKRLTINLTGSENNSSSNMTDQKTPNSTFHPNSKSDQNNTATTNTTPKLEKQSILLHAIFEREWSEVEDILKNATQNGKCDIVQQQDAQRRTPLHAAAYAGDTTMGGVKNSVVLGGDS